MIYNKARYLLGGDRYLLVDFGDELNILLSFKVVAMEREIRQSNILGLIDTAPCFRSLLIHYDGTIVSTDEMIFKLKEFEKKIPPLGEMELPSRVVEIPVAYDDKWTRECTVDYNRYSNRDYPPDCDFVIRYNNLGHLRELMEIHSAPEYWVATIGFTPAEPIALCLDPRYLLKCPHYNPPRMWTPEGTIGISDGDSGIYSVDRSPGGYRMVGRTPLRMYDPGQKHPAFKQSSSLLRIGDRLKHIPISQDEFVNIQREIDEGTFRYKIRTYELFSVRKYQEFLEETKPEAEEEQSKRRWEAQHVRSH